MEHLSTFGLTRDPFSSDLQLDTAFDAAGPRDTLRRLARAAAQVKGLCLLTGHGGVGKTLLVRRLLETLEEEVFEACMLVPVPGITDSRWMLSRFAHQLGVEELADAPADLLGQVYEQMAIVREDGRHTVLLIDEAQVLADAGLLGELRGLLNLEYEEKRLLSLLLVGLPSLRDAVQNEPALCDRVDLRICLAPLSHEEAGQYLAHRIRAVEGTPAIFESAAMSALVKWGEGLPRRLNTLADNALFEAHLAGRVSATAEDVERAAAELGLLERAGDAAEPVRRVSAPAAELAPAPQPANAPPAYEAPSAPAPLVSPAPQPEAEPSPADLSTDEPVLAEPILHAPEAPEPPDLNGIFEEAAPELELSEVVAADTNPRFANADAGATIAIFPDAPEEAPAPLSSPVAPDATVAILDDPAPASAPGIPKAAQTIAILDDYDDSTDGELDDLFADLVDD